VALTAHLHLAPKLRISGVIPLPPPTCLHGVDRDNVTFASAVSPSTSADATRVARTVTHGPLKRCKRRLV